MKLNPTSIELDATDREILELLQENCKQPLAAIGQKVGLSPPSVLERIHKLEEAGVVIGYDETSFKPDKALSREELIAIKCGLDQGGVAYKNKSYNAIELVWHWSDARKVSKRYLDAMYSEDFNSAKNVDRTFGAIKMFKPQQAVTRGEAAICMWRIGDGHESTTAAEALQGATSAGDR